MTYKLDPSKSWLYVVVWNDTSSLASRLGHDHGIKATTFTGKVTWDTANAAACKVDISFPVTALAPESAGHAGPRRPLPRGSVADRILAKIKENFLGKSQLDAATYPEIKYQSTSCEGTTGKVKVVGNLTIHGVTKPVTMTMDVKAEPTNFAAGGAINTTVSNFGFQPFTDARRHAPEQGRDQARGGRGGREGALSQRVAAASGAGANASHRSSARDQVSPTHHSVSSCFATAGLVVATAPDTTRPSRVTSGFASRARATRSGPAWRTGRNSQNPDEPGAWRAVSASAIRPIVVRGLTSPTGTRRRPSGPRASRASTP